MAQKENAQAMIEYVKKVADESTFLTFDSTEFTKTIKEEEEIIAACRTAKNKIFIVATFNNQIIGALVVDASRKNRLAHIGEFGISVLQEHWGKGVGNQLINYMIDWAKKSQIIRKLNLKVAVHNISAIRLYLKNGFVMEGKISRDAFVDGIFYDAYTMGLCVD